MVDKPTTAEGYRRSHTELVRQTCLEVATRLGDLTNEVCIVGGLVPLLIVNQADESLGFEAHVGTIDIDLGLSLVLLDHQRYQEISARLRSAGFEPDETDAGRTVTQRWRSREGVLVDFLIPPTTDADRPGGLKNLERDFAAIITPGLELAFRDQTEVLLKGTTPSGEKAERRIRVCGPAAYVVMKSLALGTRGENKDAYDLFYILQYHALGIEEIAQILLTFGLKGEVLKAIEILRRDFATAEHVGPRRVAEFMRGQADDDIQADAWGLVRDLLGRLGELENRKK